MSDYKYVKSTLQDGEHYAGLILGKEGKPDHHLVLLPGEALEVSWSAAREWAREAGGELPTRRELSLLYANLREHFERVWYWSSEPQEPRAQLVWGQNLYGRPFRGRAKAIRRLLVD
jgi:hypothetical protein